MEHKGHRNNEIDHSPGPLDGSLYAKINKNKNRSNRKKAGKQANENLVVVVEHGNKVKLKSIAKETAQIIMDNNSNIIEEKQKQDFDAAYEEQSIENGYAEIPMELGTEEGEILVKTIENKIVMIQQKKSEISQTQNDETLTTAEKVLPQESEEQTFCNNNFADEEHEPIKEIIQDMKSGPGVQVIANKYTIEESSPVVESNEKPLCHAVVHENIRVLVQGVAESENLEINNNSDPSKDKASLEVDEILESDASYEDDSETIRPTKANERLSLTTNVEILGESKTQEKQGLVESKMNLGFEKLSTEYGKVGNDKQGPTSADVSEESATQETIDAIKPSVAHDVDKFIVVHNAIDYSAQIAEEEVESDQIKETKEEIVQLTAGVPDAKLNSDNISPLNEFSDPPSISTTHSIHADIIKLAYNVEKVENVKVGDALMVCNEGQGAAVGDNESCVSVGESYSEIEQADRLEIDKEESLTGGEVTGGKIGENTELFNFYVDDRPIVKEEPSDKELRKIAKNIVDNVLHQVFQQQIGVPIIDTTNTEAYVTESNLSTTTELSTDKLPVNHEERGPSSKDQVIITKVENVDLSSIGDTSEGVGSGEQPKSNATETFKEEKQLPGLPIIEHEVEKPPLSPAIYSTSVDEVLYDVPVKRSQHIRSTSITKETKPDNLQTVQIKSKVAISSEADQPNELYFDKGPEYAVPIRDFVVKKEEYKKAILVNMNQAAQSSTYHNNRDKYVPEDVQALIKGLTSGSDADSGFDGSSIYVSGTPVSPGYENDVSDTSREDISHDDKNYSFQSNVIPPGVTIDERTPHIIDSRSQFVKQNPPHIPIIKQNKPEKVLARHEKADDTIMDVESMLEEENIKNVEDQIAHTKQHLQWLENQQVKLRTRHKQRSGAIERKRNSSALESQSANYFQNSSTLPRKLAGERPSSAAYLSEDLLLAVKQLEHVDTIPAQREMVRTANPGPHLVENNNFKPSKQHPPPPTINGSKHHPIKSDLNANDVTTSSDDLQFQLAELDKCIAQLTSSIVAPPTPEKTAGVVMRQKQSFSNEIDRRMDPTQPINGTSSVGLPAPAPPSRTRSSFNSVSRLSQEFDSKKVNLGLSDGISDDVFSPTSPNSRSKFPPQTSLTRRQQMSPEPPAKTMGSLENRLSPDLVNAMTSNPGARPKENIHSYREDLEANDPQTPGFPPSTPTVNNQSSPSVETIGGHHLAGLAQTPLSALHLKPREKPITPTEAHNSASSHVAKETNLLSDDTRNNQLEEKALREQQQLQEQLHSPQGHHKVKEQTVIANHSPNSVSSTPYSARSHGGSTDSLDGGNGSVSDHQPRHSNSSLLSSSSGSTDQHSGSSLHSNSRLRPNGGQRITRHDESYTPNSGRTSASSLSDVEKILTSTTHPPLFVHDVQNLWYKPDITREQALDMLRDKEAGHFVVRDSRCFPGAYGLALKVDKLPANVRPQPGADLQNELVRHFLIEPSSRGVKLKGCPNEPVFGSLPALVYQHSITPIALPCALIIPKVDPATPPPGTLPRPGHEVPNSATDLLRQGAACNVVYISSVETESLTGPPAIERAIQEILRNPPARKAIVHFKVSPQGVTLTDNGRKIFFRRHYPTKTVTYCGLDPRGNDARRYDTSNFGGRPDAWMFGFVARKQNSSSDNVCHIFAELEEEQPARAIVNFVSKVLIATSRP